MANNRIQIKRSTTTAITNTTPSVNAGELVFTSNGYILAIGDPANSANVISIGGARSPGILTANQSLVANSTSGIDKVIVANLVPTTIWANGAAGTAGQLLTSNGSVVYWNTPAPSVVGSDTQVQFNDGGSLGADAGLTYNKTTDTLTVVGSIFSGATVNATTIQVGPSVIANSSRLVIGTAVGLQANGGIGTAGQTLHSNGTTVYWAADDGITSLATGNGMTGGTITNTGTVSVLANNGIIANATGVYVDGANGISVTADGVNVLAGNSGVISNTSGVFVNAATFSIATSQLTGDVALGTQTSGNYVATVAAGNGIVVAGSGSETAAVTVSVLANTGVVANSTGIFIGQPVSTTSNVTFANVFTTLLTVFGNTALGDNTTDIVSITARVNTNIVPSANLTYDLGTAALRWNNVHSNNIFSNFATISGNVSIGGDLTVAGNVTTVNVSSLSVTDPLIKLAVNNTTSDTLYIGFAGHYNGFGNATNHTGLVREPSNKNYYLFSTYGDEARVENNQIIVTDPSFSLANLTTYLLSGGLVTNATNVAITANSTVGVSISANVLTLSGRSNQDVLFTNSTGGVTGLALGISGYVLQSNGTALVYDTLDGGTF